ncbi:hypothetical protein AMS68_001686 [Peltaster fructicola]|uniref:Protein BNI4 n=1 Tax=Peltaster fructicola TaxID=286661 RepID=A0A6H0XNG5_9PEZI|nr:hypothetical protein AMS68_001686 [Peltaster fructicola]
MCQSAGEALRLETFQGDTKIAFLIDRFSRSLLYDDPPAVLPPKTIAQKISISFQDPTSQSPRLSQTPRSMYSQGTTSYRGVTAAPVQPYAFQSTPHLRQDARTVSTPTVQSSLGAPIKTHVATGSISSGSDNSSAKDDSVIGSRTGSLINLSSVPDLSLIDLSQPVKPSPDRYRRPGQRRGDSKGATTPVPSTQEEDSARSTLPSQRPTSVDDMAVRGATESAKRYRRRSLNNLDTTNILSQGDAEIVAGIQRPQSSGPGVGATSTPTSINPSVFHRRTSSKDAVERASSPLAQLDNSADTVKPVNTLVGRPDAKNVSVPPRTSSEATKRITTPSPLSQSNAQDSPEASPAKPRSYAAVAQAAVKVPSPAAQQLAAVSDRDLNKGMKSRLRRAFSFGSAQELRRASAQNNISTATAGQGLDDELDPEQQEIARRQEAAGFGAGIYSGQGGFTGSTDNISISSTASSASLMLRKMGQSARKSARSIKGLFRPKSVIGVPAADGPVQPQPSQAPQPSVAQVSMVTVEAERHRVNVNADPAERAGGGTGYPKLEQNSLDAPIRPSTRGSADGTESAASRRSIVGSDKDRAEVLAAVKKGILKRSGTDSPVLSTPDVAVPHIIENPPSTTPGTPHGRTGSGNGDYFSPRLQLLTHTKSMPSTPNGSVRNISFSPRIQFHDAFSATEYDRRGEVATCNRLTPLLAQQIKEELNNFKMEMEVHELSKPHTHFF